MVLVTDDHMVNQLDLQQLTGASQIAGHFDVGLRWGAFTTGMIVLCNAPSYVQLPIVGADITSVFRRDDVLWMRMSHPRPAVLIWEFAR